MRKTRSCNYSLEAPDDERYRPKHVEQSRYNGIINCPTQLHLVGHFYIYVYMYKTSYGQPVTRPETKKQKLEKRISNTCKSRYQSTGSWAF